MSHVKYICLSDTHFGAKNSILTNPSAADDAAQALHPPDVLRKLVECLATLIDSSADGTRPVLILNGDILELALCETDVAGMAFTAFLDLIVPPTGRPPFERIIYVPGNHDHHLWETARENQYLEYLKTRAQSRDPLPSPRHATHMLIRHGVTIEVPADFLIGLLERIGRQVPDRYITTFYPSFGLLSGDFRRCAIFNHGHYTEGIYYLMSELRRLIYSDREPLKTVEQIETENFAWIDFFWSGLGRSGGVGADVGLIYDDLQYPDRRNALFGNLTKNLIARWRRLPMPLRHASYEIGVVLGKLLSRQFRGLEKHATDRPLSDRSWKDLTDYLQGPLYAQLGAELNKYPGYPAHSGVSVMRLADIEPPTGIELAKLPPKLTFIFGHTHKPFCDTRPFRFGAKTQFERQVNVYNTGGWVVESDKPAPCHGAAIVLLDEDLNGVLLRLYLENLENRPFKVSSLQATGDKALQFLEHIDGRVQANATCWQEFSGLAEQAVDCCIQAEQQRKREQG